MKPIASHSPPLRIAAAALPAAMVTLGVTACGGSDDSSETGSDSWRIGLEAPLSGDLQTLGEGMLDGAELAADEINADGGLLGRTSRSCRSTTAAIRDRRPGRHEGDRRGLDGVIGPYNSGVGIETLPLYVNAGWSLRLTSDDDTAGFGFTTQPMSSQIAPVTAEALTKWIGASKVGIAYDPTQNYTTEVADAVKSALESDGVEVTAFEQVEPGAEDYSGVVEKLADGDPDAVYYAVYYPEGALIAQATQGSAPGASSTTPATTPGTWRTPARPTRPTAPWSECRRLTTSRTRAPTSPPTASSSAARRAPGVPTRTTRSMSSRTAWSGRAASMRTSCRPRWRK